MHKVFIKAVKYHINLSVHNHYTVANPSPFYDSKISTFANTQPTPHDFLKQSDAFDFRPSALHRKLSPAEANGAWGQIRLHGRHIEPCVDSHVVQKQRARETDELWLCSNVEIIMEYDRCKKMLWKVRCVWCALQSISIYYVYSNSNPQQMKTYTLRTH